MSFAVTPRSRLGLAGLVAALCWAGPAPSRAESTATPAILEDLRRFANTGTVLHVGAHPDDENTQLISAMARGRGYRTGYLSLTRGDGGQNESGPEFGEKLGVARTQELLAARRLDGGRQFFTRAIDYGYSKSAEEALRIWDHDTLLGDVVRVIRTFRPDVIITRFPIPPGSGGHGQHTASAILAVEAFKLAGDPTAYPEQIAEGLLPWQPKRIGWNGWGSGASPLPGPTIQFDIGGADPVTGEPFSTMANRSRSMHKTQGLGNFAARTGGPGPNMQTFQLLAGDPPTKDLMDGVDTTWNRVPEGAALIPLINETMAGFKPADPAASVPSLFAIRAQLAALPANPLVQEKRADLDRIIAACLGLTVETTIPRAEVVPGEKIALHQAVTVTGSLPVRWIEVNYPGIMDLNPTPELHASTSLKDPVTVQWATPSHSRAHVKVNAVVTPDHPGVSESSQTLGSALPISQPYWLRRAGSPGLFDVQQQVLIGEPENRPLITVEYVFEVAGQTFRVSDEPVQIVAGASEAQSRRRMVVIPPVSLGFPHEPALFAPGSTKPVTVEITASRAGIKGGLHLTAPTGWLVSPASLPFGLEHAGDRTTLAFTVTAPIQSGSATLAATAEVGEIICNTKRFVINYAHIPQQVLQSPAEIQAVVLQVQTRGHRVGYLPGAGDSISESIAQLGYEVIPLTGADLSPAKLAGLDAVVLGVRAFNDRTDLAAALPGLLAWVEAGGTVISQYNRPDRNLNTAQLGPYPLSIEGRPPDLRVTDETAPVIFLTPEHPVLNVPNKITAADFENWVQERGAYFPSKWDESHYTAILAMNDPGEAPLRSSLLVAQYGKGRYVYTGLSFFRQLPAGNPGAHRLFANLLSLGR